MRGSRMVVYDVFDVTHRMISVQFLLLLCVPSQLLLVGPADRLRTAYLRTPSINTEERTKNKKKKHRTHVHIWVDGRRHAFTLGKFINHRFSMHDVRTMRAAVIYIFNACVM